jgi:hypothetical protein
MVDSTLIYVRSTRIILSLFILTFYFSVISGQELSQEAPPIRQRLFFGGNLALQFGTITNIEISPLIGFWVLPNLAVAAGPTFSFYKDSYYNIKYQNYGVRAYVQFLILRDIDKFIPIGIHTSIFLHLEDEMLSLDPEYLPATSVSSNRININTLLGGAGLSQQIGPRSSLNFMVLWTLTDSGYEVYSNPVIRIGFVF